MDIVDQRAEVLVEQIRSEMVTIDRSGRSVGALLVVLYAEWAGTKAECAAYVAAEAAPHPSRRPGVDTNAVRNGHPRIKKQSAETIRRRVESRQSSAGRRLLSNATR